MLTLHALAPEFSLSDQDGITHTRSQYLGKKILIYFYPKDDTPGCTREACEFRDSYEDFKKAGLVILGVSKDSTKSHKKFTEKYTLPFPLLSDESTEMIRSYGAWGKKKFMGREYEGIFRNSVFIDETGLVEKIFTEVKPETHAKEVEESIK